MDISIRFEAVEPPEGRVHREGHRDWLPFVGWLELISAIERFVEAARRPLPRVFFEAVTPSDPPTEERKAPPLRTNNDGTQVFQPTENKENGRCDASWFCC